MGQNSCEVVKVRRLRNKLSNFKVKGTNKDLLRKPVDKLFDSVNSKFNVHDTITIDNSREKHIMNESEKAIL